MGFTSTFEVNGRTESAYRSAKRVGLVPGAVLQLTFPSSFPIQWSIVDVPKKTTRMVTLRNIHSGHTFLEPIYQIRTMLKAQQLKIVSSPVTP